MKGIVLDCSVVCGIIFENQRTPYAVSVGEALQHHQGIVPALFISEITNVLMTQERRKNWSSDVTNAFLAGLEQFPLFIEPAPGLHHGSAIASFARAHGISAYDATYLAVAAQHRTPLATQDAKLQRAAQGEGLFFCP